MKPELMLSGKPKVLVVEDNMLVRQVSVGLLRMLRCDTLEASDGESALQLLSHGEPVDLLFTDIVMPGDMNGFRLAALARERHPGLRVLFTSGYSAESLPFDDPAVSESKVLAKPYCLADLSRALQDLLPESAHAA